MTNTGRRGSLCPRCGAVHPAPVPAPDGTYEGACLECGLGFSGATLSSGPQAAQAGGLVRRLRRPSRSLRDFEKDLMATFAAPPFAPFGLNVEWTGPRWPAGVGSSSQGQSLELGHGDPNDDHGPQLRVVTKQSTDLPIELRETARHLVHSLWSNGADHTDAVRAPFTAEDPTDGWEGIEIAVDGSPLPFKMLASRRSWVACATVADFIVTIEGQNFAAHEVELTRFDDLGPYLNPNAFPWHDWPGR